MKQQNSLDAIERAQRSADLLDRALQDVARDLRDLAREQDRRDTQRPRDSLTATTVSV